jgi:hypothetical protein
MPTHTQHRLADIRKKLESMPSTSLSKAYIYSAATLLLTECDKQAVLIQKMRDVAANACNDAWNLTMVRGALGDFLNESDD